MTLATIVLYVILFLAVFCVPLWLGYTLWNLHDRKKSYWRCVGYIMCGRDMIDRGWPEPMKAEDKPSVAKPAPAPRAPLAPMTDEEYARMGRNILRFFERPWPAHMGICRTEDGYFRVSVLPVGEVIPGLDSYSIKVSRLDHGVLVVSGAAQMEQLGRDFSQGLSNFSSSNPLNPAPTP